MNYTPTSGKKCKKHKTSSHFQSSSVLNTTISAPRKIISDLQHGKKFFILDIVDYTGMTSKFDVSSHLKTIPSRLAGNVHLDHCHPVANGSGGGTIMSTFSFR